MPSWSSPRWVVGFVWIGDSWWQLVSAAVLAVLMTQIAFLGHDAAHRQIFKSGRWNDWVSLVLANLFVGISYGWWQSKHTRHHANPNKDGYDPDIALTAIAFTPAMATRHRSRLLRWLVAHQGWYFFPILLLEGLSLHIDGVRRVLRPRQARAPLGRVELSSPSGSAAWPRSSSWCCRRRRRSPSSPCSSPSVRVSTWVRRSPRTTSACRWSRPS